MRLSVLLVWALLLVSPAAGQTATIESRAERCKIALAYIDILLTQFPQKVILTNEGKHAYYPLVLEGWFSEDGSPSAGPPADLLTAANHGGRIDALSSCPSMARQLKKGAYKKRIVVVELPLNPLEFSDKPITEIRVAITLPVISPDKKSAILFSSQASGPLAAGAAAYYVAYSAKNGWVVVSSKGLAVS
jgi:hypothetical protein